jgi:hypothetical protein
LSQCGGTRGTRPTGASSLGSRGSTRRNQFPADKLAVASPSTCRLLSGESGCRLRSPAWFFFAAVIIFRGHTQPPLAVGRCLAGCVQCHSSGAQLTAAGWRAARGGGTALEQAVSALPHAAARHTHHTSRTSKLAMLSLPSLFVTCMVMSLGAYIPLIPRFDFRTQHQHQVTFLLLPAQIATVRCPHPRSPSERRVCRCSPALHARTRVTEASGKYKPTPPSTHARACGCVGIAPPCSPSRTTPYAPSLPPSTSNTASVH